jgi:hypothetical protein
MFERSHRGAISVDQVRLAMAGAQDKKQQIAGDLAKARMQAHDDTLLLRRYLDVRQGIVQSIQHYPW